MDEKLLTMFKRGVADIGDDSDYYAKAFNEGIRLWHEIKRTSSPIVIAELILAFERYKQWENANNKLMSLRLAEKYESEIDSPGRDDKNLASDKLI